MGTCSPSSKLDEYCIAAHTTPPKQVENFQAPYDAHGCVAPNVVHDTCNGIYDVLAGPTVKGKQCCYTVCRGPVAPCGRVLLDDCGEARQAAVVPTWDWCGEAVEALPAVARAAWLADALLEHASIAAFARFSLELLAVGAPPSFVEAAHRAALDEVEHARMAFALAGGGDGPAPLDLAGVAPRTDLATIAEAAADECCVGETFAALVAREALRDATHAGACAALERISEDEGRHAELGFRFVAWAIARGGDPVRAAVASGFARGLCRLASTTVAPGSRATMRAAGRLDRDALEDAQGSATLLVGDAAAALGIALGPRCAA